MTKSEADELLKSLEEYVRETTSSPEKALAALVAAGLVDESGQPTPPYRD